MDFTKLIEAGPLGVVVFLVIAFGYYLYKRDKAQELFISSRDQEWREFLKQQRENDKQVSQAVKDSLDALTEITRSLVIEVRGQRADFQAHDKAEWAKLDEMSASIHSEPKTQPRKRPQ